MISDKKIKNAMEQIATKELAEDGLVVQCQVCKKNNLFQRIVFSPAKGGFLSYAKGNLYFVPVKKGELDFENLKTISFSDIAKKDVDLNLSIYARIEFEFRYTNGNRDYFYVPAHYQQQIKTMFDKFYSTNNGYAEE